jgi:DNA adenine methylase
MSSVQWLGKGTWIEPFLGSGVILFNVRPHRAIVNDINPHIIRFYESVYTGVINYRLVKEYLIREGQKLLDNGRIDRHSYYYEVRDRFNDEGNPLDFLFLSRACFNGMMRFNSSGEFNVPFCRKPDRFRPAYITKIANQVRILQGIMKGKEWEFRVGDWRDCLNDVRAADFAYFDPPYIGRHTDYYNQWSEQDALELAQAVPTLPCGYAVSMWKENKYRVNGRLQDDWGQTVQRTQKHYYHVGPTEALRNEVEEALLIRPGFEAQTVEKVEPDSGKPFVQLGIPLLEM